MIQKELSSCSGNYCYSYTGRCYRGKFVPIMEFEKDTMAFLVNVPASCRIFTFFFYVLSCTITITRFLSRDLCRRTSMEGAVAGAKNAKDITRCSSPCCRSQQTPSPSAQNIDSSLTSTASVAEEDDDDANGLFAPIPPRPECPICMLTLPLRGEGVMCMSCCGNMICSACIYEIERVIQQTNATRKARNPHNPCLLELRCPLCRERIPRNDEEELSQIETENGA